jgi:hypothetical protein
MLLRGLFVIARNSSFAYKGCAVDLKEVGRELGVHYILEGSVRKTGSMARRSSTGRPAGMMRDSSAPLAMLSSVCLTPSRAEQQLSSGGFSGFSPKWVQESSEVLGTSKEDFKADKAHHGLILMAADLVTQDWSGRLRSFIQEMP